MKFNKILIGIACVSLLGCGGNAEEATDAGGKPAVNNPNPSSTPADPGGAAPPANSSPGGGPAPTNGPAGDKVPPL